MWPDDDAILRRIFDNTTTWAVVGCSPDPARDSHRIGAYLRDLGYRVVPVNPNEHEVLGEPCHPDLDTAVAAIGPIDVVDVFRRSSAAGRHVDEAIAIGAKAVWLQLRVVDEAAAQRAADAGLDVAMDRCPRIEHPRLYGR
jgi:uncharacterized protein